MYGQQHQQQQYYHQPASTSTTTTTAGMVWNGNSWVASDKNSQVSAAANGGGGGSNGQNLVRLYTDYYSGWQAHKQQLETQLRSLMSMMTTTPSSASNQQQQQSQVDGLQTRIRWAQYYSDESSRAAHHYYSNPNNPPPFELPPAPPGFQGSAASAAPSQQTHQQQQQRSYAPPASAHVSSPSPAGSAPAGSFTRYLRRCLEQCGDDDVKKKAVQSTIKHVIEDAIREGNLHSRDWDLVPLVVVPGGASAGARNHTSSYYGSVSSSSQASHYGPPGGQQQQQHYQQQQHVQSFSSYGPTTGYYEPASDTNTHNSLSSQTTSSSSQGYRKRWGYSPSTSVTPIGAGTGTDVSYYGPSSSSSPSSSSLSNSFQLQQQQHNYYTNVNKKRGLDQDEDFVILPRIAGGNNKKYKKSKTNTSYSLVNVSSNNQGMDSSDDALAKRVSRFGHGYQQSSDVELNSQYYDGGVGQYDRFMGKGVIGGTHKVLDDDDFERMTVKGTCTVLEKDYLRLTAPPRAELVRPLAILEQHVKNLNDEYYGTKDNKHDYLWFCSQFKAVRQDCTVQRIQGRFAIEVYESHARIALREGDLNEYNQCQTQLKELYRHINSANDNGSDNDKDDNENDTTDTPKSNKSNDQQNQNEYLFEYEPHEEEFIAYRLLYYIYLSTNDKFSGGSGDMLHILLSLSPTQRADGAISHALQVREAVALDDYLSFFRLHKTTPNLGSHLTSLLVPTMRLRALRRMAKAYRPSVAVAMCLEHLGFIADETTTKDADQPCPSPIAKEGEEWLVSCGCVIEGQDFMTKDSVIHEPITTTKNSLI